MSFVYMIQGSPKGPVKIGFTFSPAVRLISLQAAHHETLRIIRLFHGGQPEEARLHARFSSLKIRGEWFKYDEQLMGDVGLDEIETNDISSAPKRTTDVPDGYDRKMWRQAIRLAAADSSYGTAEENYQRIMAQITRSAPLFIRSNSQ